MKLLAKSRLQASRSSPTDGGATFDMLNDGPLDHTPEIQQLTENDGSTQEAPEQALLIDDLAVGK